VVLILQDNTFGMICWKKKADGFADWGLSFGNSDFSRYAEAYGAQRALRGRRQPGWSPCKAGGVELVVVPVDYSENIRVLTDELSQRIHRSQ
jgi:acetolactate synthase-1/2/3 large subunit